MPMAAAGGRAVPRGGGGLVVKERIRKRGSSCLTVEPRAAYTNTIQGLEKVSSGPAESGAVVRVRVSGTG